MKKGAAIGLAVASVAALAALAALGPAPDAPRQQSTTAPARASNASTPTGDTFARLKAESDARIACAARIAADLPGLEATEQQGSVTLAAGRVEVVQPVRLADAFRAAPVGLVRCTREGDGDMAVAKIRQ